MKKILFALTLISTLNTFALNQKSVIINGNEVKNVLSSFNFNYFIKYTGESLSGDYENGATFNRFDGGSQNGQDYDTTGSYGLYQSFRLGYKFSNSWNLSYGVTFQENLTDDVEYENIFGQKQKRNNGRSYNNHRLSLFVPSIVSLNFGWIGGAYFYELPNSSSKALGMKSGIGFQPTLNFFSKVSGLSYGINSSLEKYFFKSGTVNPQGVKVSAGPFVNYRMSDRFTLKNELSFDWDQKGSEVGTTRFGSNMHDIGIVGLGIRAMNNAFLDLFLNYSISEMSSKNTALGASFGITI